MVQDGQAPGYSCRTASAEERHCEDALTSSKEAHRNATAGHGNRRRSTVPRDKAMQAPLCDTISDWKRPQPPIPPDSRIFLQSSGIVRAIPRSQLGFWSCSGTLGLKDFLGNQFKFAHSVAT